VEVLRKDFCAYLEQLRRTLAALQDELPSAKGRDDAQLAMRTLNLFAAEYSYLDEHEAGLARLLEALERELEPHFRSGALSELRNALIETSAASEKSERQKLGERLDHFRRAIPELVGLARIRSDVAQLLRRYTDAEFARIEGVNRIRDEHEKMPLVAPASAAANPPPLTPDRVQDYLRTAFPDERELIVTSLANVPGGRSKETTVIALEQVRALPDRLIMRADIPGGLVPSRVTDEFAILRLAERHGVPVPKPIFCEPDAARLGTAFILVSLMPGRTEGQYFPEINGRVRNKADVGRQIARILARIHSIPSSELTGTHIDPDENIAGLILQTIETTYAQARSFDHPWRVPIDLAYIWLKENLDRAGGEPCLIHCDVGLHNMLINEGRVSAMLDWELACLGTPAREIAKIQHLIDYLMPRGEFFAEYLAAGGSPEAVDPAKVQFYAILNYMVTNQRARYANHLFHSGTRNSILMANAGFDSYYRGSRLLARMMQEVGVPGVAAQDRITAAEGAW
jgi:aminoglycoside phosphotransferase (APT) family kinase protein